MKKPMKVYLQLTEAAIGSKLIIDGIDFSDKVNRVVIDAAAGAGTKVTLYFPTADVTCLGDTWVTMTTRERLQWKYADQVAEAKELTRREGTDA